MCTQTVQSWYNTIHLAAWLTTTGGARCIKELRDCTVRRDDDSVFANFTQMCDFPTRFRTGWCEVSRSIAFGPPLSFPHTQHDEEEAFQCRWKYQHLMQSLIIDKEQNADVIKEAISAWVEDYIWNTCPAITKSTFARGVTLICKVGKKKIING